MLKGKKKTKGGGGGSYFTGTLNTTKVKHLSTCKHWKANLEKGKKGKEKEQWRKKEKKKPKSKRNGISCDLAFFLGNRSLHGN